MDTDIAKQWKTSDCTWCCKKMLFINRPKWTASPRRQNHTIIMSIAWILKSVMLTFHLNMRFPSNTQWLASTVLYKSQSHMRERDREMFYLTTPSTYFYLRLYYLRLYVLWCRWVVGSIIHGVDPLSYFSLQSVLHDWCNKDRGMCYPVCGMVHIKEPLLLIRNRSLCGGFLLFYANNTPILLAVVCVILSVGWCI